MIAVVTYRGSLALIGANGLRLIAKWARSLPIAAVLFVLVGFVQAQTVSVPPAVSASGQSPSPIERGAPAAPAAPVVATPPVVKEESCADVTDHAMGLDLAAAQAASQKKSPDIQSKSAQAAVDAWFKVVGLCQGRALDRAQRNLQDSKKTLAAAQERAGADPRCADAHRDAAALQDMARQTLAERRWTEASVLFRKAENRWEVAGERCTGQQRDIADRRREQSEIDAHNAEHCAPFFEKSRDYTQKVRASTATATKEAKQDPLNIAETMWRDALKLCKGPVQDTVRNNIQALARERGTSWVEMREPGASKPAPALATVAAPATVSAKSVVQGAAATPASSLVNPRPSATVGAGAPVAAAVPAAVVAATAAAAVTTAAPAVIAPSVSALNTASDKDQTMPPEFELDGTRFQGKFVRDAGLRTFSGEGKVTWANGDVYDGTLVKGVRHGKGLFKWPNGQTYDGDWVGDKATGKGFMRMASGDEYDGSVADGTPNGPGRFVWKNGQSVRATWVNGKAQGKGLLHLSSGDVYEGELMDAVPHGKGRMTYKVGGTYEGNFVQGTPEGFGTFVWANGDQYEGNWKAGLKHGYGKFTWKSGEVWDGEYVNDQQGKR